jgi:purine-binding chemotaxis protein CheW
MTEQLHLVAHVGGCGVLFDATRVDSVVDVGQIVPAPGASAAVIGLAAMRSRVATVLDIRGLLGLPVREGRADGAGMRAVATIVDGHLYAIAVDTLEDVVTHEILPPPTGIARDGRWSIVHGVVEGRAETLLALDLDRLVAEAALA